MRVLGFNPMLASDILPEQRPGSVTGCVSMVKWECPVMSRHPTGLGTGAATPAAGGLFSEPGTGQGWGRPPAREGTPTVPWAEVQSGGSRATAASCVVRSLTTYGPGWKPFILLCEVNKWSLDLYFC